MKRSAFYTKLTKLCFLCLTLAVMPQQSMAQITALPANFTGTGLTPEELAKALEENPNQRFYLYNVGKDMFLNAGGYFGTRTATFTTGLPLKISVAADGNTYHIQGPFVSETGGNYLGFLPNHEQTGTQGVYFNRNENEKNTYIHWMLKRDYNASPYDGNVYRIAILVNDEEYQLRSGETMEIQAFKKEKGGNNNLVKAVKNNDIDEGDRNLYWKIVPEENLVAQFPATYRKAKPSGATFLISAQNFNRHNKYNTYDEETGRGWQTSSKGQMLFSHDFSGEFFDANGNDLYHDGDDVDKSFAMFYCGSIKKANKGDKVYQTIMLPRSGWYKLECQGFCNDYTGDDKTNSKDSYAKLYAKFGNAAQEDTPEWRSKFLLKRSDRETAEYIGTDVVPVDENTFDNIEFLGKDIRDNKVSNKVEAGVVFYCLVYSNSLLVYANFAEENGAQPLEIGIEITEDMTDDDYVYFDDFRLRYHGESIALSQNWNNFSNCGKDNDIEDTESEYINRPLLLKRDLTLRKWNSLCLPVDLTRQSLEDAFYTTASFAKLCNSTEEGAIAFKTINLSSYGKDDIVIRKGEAFIIKPQPGGTYILSGTGYAGDKGLSEVDGPFYTIPRMTLCKGELLGEGGLLNGKDLKRFQAFEYNNDVVIDKDHFFTVKGDDYKECKLRIFATFENGATAPKNSYVMYNSDLYHIPGDGKMMGYSWWIEDEHQCNQSGAKGHKLAFKPYVDGISTSIEGVTTDITERDMPLAVYSVYGQVVRRGTTSLEGLPSGMYIVNGKKVAVK